MGRVLSWEKDGLFRVWKRLLFRLDEGWAAPVPCLEVGRKKDGLLQFPVRLGAARAS